MRLKPSRPISENTFWNCGVSRYLANSASQSDCCSGGSAPTIGCHSVIDSPECVSRVTPPTTIIANTSTQHSASQAISGRCAAGNRFAGAGNAAAALG